MIRIDRPRLKRIKQGAKLSFIIRKIARPVRRRLKKIVQNHTDAGYSRRANGILLLFGGYNVTQTAMILNASRTSVRRWRKRYESYGEAGLAPEQRGRSPDVVTEALCAKVLELIQVQPGHYGYLRIRWTSEMLAMQLYEWQSIRIHASTIRRLLPNLGIVWNRARPTLCIKDRAKARKMKAIQKALKKSSKTHPVFYVDEADIDLNPRIGYAWMKKGQQTAIPTPGKNKKRYLAGTLNANTGNVVWVELEKKNSEIFIRLLAELRKRYRRAKKIRLIADNYVIHKSAMTMCFLQDNPKFEILFQPAYHPWVNKIELLWKQLHDMITRNHRYSTMNKLMNAVRSFMRSVSLYPGSSPLYYSEK